MTTIMDVEEGRQPDRIVPPKGAAQILGVSLPTMYRLRKRGLLPDQVRVSPGRTGWWLSDILRYVEHMSSSEGPRAARRIGQRFRTAPPAPSARMPRTAQPSAATRLPGQPLSFLRRAFGEDPSPSATDAGAGGTTPRPRQLAPRR